MTFSEVSFSHLWPKMAKKTGFWKPVTNWLIWLGPKMEVTPRDSFFSHTLSFIFKKGYFVHFFFENLKSQKILECLKKHTKGIEIVVFYKRPAVTRVYFCLLVFSKSVNLWFLDYTFCHFTFLTIFKEWLRCISIKKWSLLFSPFLNKKCKVQKVVPKSWFWTLA